MRSPPHSHQLATHVRMGLNSADCETVVAKVPAATPNTSNVDRYSGTLLPLLHHGLALGWLLLRDSFLQRFTKDGLDGAETLFATG